MGQTISNAGFVDSQYNTVTTEGGRAAVLLIALTGNYTFFNLLAMALTIWLFVEPSPWPASRMRRAVDIVLVGFIGVTSGLITLHLLSADLPPGGTELLGAVACAAATPHAALS